MCYDSAMRSLVIVVAALLLHTASSSADPAKPPACPDQAALKKLVAPKLATLKIDGKPVIDSIECQPGSFPKPGWYVEAHVTHKDFVDLYGFVITAPKTILAAGWIFTIAQGKATPKTRKIEKVEDRDHDGVDEVYASGTDGTTKVFNVVALKSGHLAYSVLDKL